MIYKDQSLLNIELETGYDLEDADEVKILYRKPDGTTGEFTGVVSESTKIVYAVSDGDLDQAGTWQFQAYAEIDGRIGYGSIVYETIHPNLE